MPSPSLSFQQIHEQYRSRISRFLAGLAGAGEADDLCQEVFLKVDRGLKDLRDEAKLSTWIYRIATNTFHDHVRGHAFQQRQHEQPTPTEEIAVLKEELADRSEKPLATEQQVIRKEMIDCIRGYIDQLPEDYKVVLLLGEDEGFKNREIAEILGISLDNVKIRLHRARARLKEILEARCEFYLDDRSEIACDRRQGSD